MPAPKNPDAPQNLADAPAQNPAQDASSPGLVMCKKLRRSLPALSAPPWPGALGQRIQAEISAEAWELWKEHAKMLINEYRLNLGTQEARAIMAEQMEAFLFGEGHIRVAEGYVPKP